ncbi:hypothetical protein BV25DRAFT_1597201 [Artomyces pyxidatus]|uniref:Uncharacterized protein n=1 Tax=Artomyces pyxidatus TaxID=48021 RepID=A0ACB8TA68_9AGAM|nr:hypothetical protein BV25DRAFT_1597201 [Artomyces pyxidatus]
MNLSICPCKSACSTASALQSTCPTSLDLVQEQLAPSCQGGRGGIPCSPPHPSYYILSSITAQTASDTETVEEAEEPDRFLTTLKKVKLSTACTSRPLSQSHRAGRQVQGRDFFGAFANHFTSIFHRSIPSHYLALGRRSWRKQNRLSSPDAVLAESDSDSSALCDDDVMRGGGDVRRAQARCDRLWGASV